MVGWPDYGLLAQLLWVTIVRAHWLVGSMWHSSHKAQKSRRVMYLIIQRRRETGRIFKPQTTTTNQMAHKVLSKIHDVFVFDSTHFQSGQFTDPTT